MASNGKLITKDFADQLNTKSMDPDKKYEMTEEESDDMLVWNWAEFLEHHVFTIEERKIAANRLRWFWTRIRFTIWRYRRTVLTAYKAWNNSISFNIFWFVFFRCIRPAGSLFCLEWTHIGRSGACYYRVYTVDSLLFKAFSSSAAERDVVGFGGFLGKDC